MQNIPMLPVQLAETRGIVAPDGNGAAVQLKLVELLPPIPIHKNGGGRRGPVVPQEFHFSIPLDIALSLAVEMLKSAITTQVAREVINGKFGNIALPHFVDADASVANARSEIEENFGDESSTPAPESPGSSPGNGSELPASGPERREPAREI